VLPAKVISQAHSRSGRGWRAPSLVDQLTGSSQQKSVASFAAVGPVPGSLMPEVHMRKFVFSSAMIGVIAGGWNTVQATRHGPRDWRLVMLWLGWGLSAAVAIGTVIEDANKRQIES
jgi:hypothetical protein